MEKPNKKYIINGVEYDSLDQVPEAHRSSIDAFKKIVNSDGSAVGKAVRLLFFTLTKKKSTSKEEAPASQSIRNHEQGFFSSALFKIMLMTMLVTIIVYLTMVSNKNVEQPDVIAGTDTVVQDSHEEENSVPVLQEDLISEEDNPIEDSEPGKNDFDLLLDDPNEPPYQVYLGVFDNDNLLLRIDAPSGELMESDEKNVIRFRVEKEGNTNLEQKVIKVEWMNTEDERLPADPIFINGVPFFKSLEVGDATGHHYETYRYSYSFKGGELIVSIIYKLRNAAISEASFDNFDIEKDIQKYEYEMLATLRHD